MQPEGLQRSSQEFWKLIKHWENCSLRITEETALPGEVVFESTLYTNKAVTKNSMTT